MTHMNQVTSQTITAIRFPMIVFVVLLHTFIINRPIGGVIYVPEGKFLGFDIFQQLIQNEICTVAVPMFFFISGFLFFNNMGEFKMRSLLNKLKRRISSLLIPYLLWNIIFLLFVCLIGWFYPALLTYKKSLLQMSLYDFFYSFWDPSQGLLPLWFLRDLMIVNLFAPIIFVLLRSKYSKFLLVLFALLYIAPTKIHFLPGIGMRCVFPYMFGAWFSVNNKDFLEEFKKGTWKWICISIFLVLACLWVWYHNNYSFVLDKIKDLSLIVTFFLLVEMGVARKKIRVSRLLAEVSFFVFVFHMFIIHIPLKLWVKVLPVNGWTASFCLILIPVLVSYVSVSFYMNGKKVFPKQMDILMGSRK